MSLDPGNSLSLPGSSSSASLAPGMCCLPSGWPGGFRSSPGQALQRLIRKACDNQAYLDPLYTWVCEVTTQIP